MTRTVIKSLLVSVSCAAIVFAAAQPSCAQDTLSGALSEKYAVSLVLPFLKFQPNAAPMPGATVDGLTVTSIGKAQVLSFANARICTPPAFDYGRGQGTYGRIQQFSLASGGGLVAQEAMQLFGLDAATVRSVKGYEVSIRNARFYTLPFKELRSISATTRGMSACGGQATTKTVIKPLIADIELKLSTTAPLPPSALAQIAAATNMTGPQGAGAEQSDLRVYTFQAEDAVIGVRVE